MYLFTGIPTFNVHSLNNYLPRVFLLKYICIVSTWWVFLHFWINCSICSSVNAVILVLMQRCDQGIFSSLFRTRWCDHVGEIKIADWIITLYRWLRWAFLAGIEMFSIQAIFAEVVSLVSLAGKSVSAAFLAEISDTLAMNKREKNRSDFSLRDNCCDCPRGFSVSSLSWGTITIGVDPGGWGISLPIVNGEGEMAYVITPPHGVKS